MYPNQEDYEYEETLRGEHCPVREVCGNCEFKKCKYYNRHKKYIIPIILTCICLMYLTGIIVSELVSKCVN